MRDHELVGFDEARPLEKAVFFAQSGECTLEVRAPRTNGGDGLTRTNQELEPSGLNQHGYGVHICSSELADSVPFLCGALLLQLALALFISTNCVFN